MLEAFLFLFTGIIGLVTISLMAISYKSNQLFNIFLMLIFVMTSIRFLIHGSYELNIQSVLNPDRGLSSILYLTIVPLFYLYYKSVVKADKIFNSKSLKHFVFIILFYVINSNAFLYNSVLFYYGFVTNIILLGLFVIFYLLLTLKLLRSNLWIKTNIQINSTHYSLVKNWTIYLFILNTLGAIGLIFSLYSEFTSDSSISGKSMAMVLLLFWLFIYFKILVSPEILYGIPILNKKLLLHNISEEEPHSINNKIDNGWVLSSTVQKNNQDTRLEENLKSNILSYINEIDTLSFEQNIFRNSKIHVGEIADVLGVPTSHIVYLFKYHSKMTFSEYRMNSRIQDSINLMSDGYLKVNTLESLAFKTGFSSYNPFYSSFKKNQGLSPQEYIQKQSKHHNSTIVHI